VKIQYIIKIKLNGIEEAFWLYLNWEENGWIIMRVNKKVTSIYKDDLTCISREVKWEANDKKHNNKAKLDK